MSYFSLENVPHTIEEKMAQLRETWDIYVYSFPEHERRAIEAYETMCRVEPGFTPYTIRDASGAAMGLVWYWAMDGFAYLEHFAVAKTHRNAGVGAQILAEFLKSYPNVVLEVEEPVDDITRRRVAFYCRNGMTFNDFSYTNPGY